MKENQVDLKCEGSAGTGLI